MKFYATFVLFIFCLILTQFEKNVFENQVLSILSGSFKSALRKDAGNNSTRTEATAAQVKHSQSEMGKE